MGRPLFLFLRKTSTFLWQILLDKSLGVRLVPMSQPPVSPWAAGELHAAPHCFPWCLVAVSAETAVPIGRVRVSNREAKAFLAHLSSTVPATPCVAAARLSRMLAWEGVPLVPVPATAAGVDSPRGRSVLFSRPGAPSLVACLLFASHFSSFAPSAVPGWRRPCPVGLRALVPRPCSPLPAPSPLPGLDPPWLPALPNGLSFRPPFCLRLRGCVRRWAGLVSRSGKLLCS